jgi:hypothetical protein
VALMQGADWIPLLLALLDSMGVPLQSRAQRRRILILSARIPLSRQAIEAGHR